MTSITLGLKRRGKQSLLGTLIEARGILPRFLIEYALKSIKLGFSPTDEKSSGAVSICRYKGGAEAACCISVDFDHPFANPEKTTLNSDGTIALVELSERYDIPLSWAICGNTALTDKLAYRRILESTVSQDIGVHTFSHRDFTDPGCSDEEAEKEIIKCIESLDTIQNPKTFIFPWNRESKYHILSKSGLTAYRSKNRRLGYPMKEHNLWNIPPTYYMDEKSFGADRIVKKFVDLSIAYRSVCHLWTHPWSVSVDGNVKLYFEKTLEPIFQYLAERRDDGQLWICTMSDLANYCEARENCEILDQEVDDYTFKFRIRSNGGDGRFDLPTQVTFRIPVNGRTWSVLVNDSYQVDGVNHPIAPDLLDLYMPSSTTGKNV